MTTIISSQKFIDEGILAEKIAAMEAQKPAELVLEAWDVKAYDCAVLSGGHHRLEAARILKGIIYITNPRQNSGE